MKRKCKNVDICDGDLILGAVLQCFAPSRKRRRHDTVHLFKKYLPNCSRKEVARILKHRGEQYFEACFSIAKDLQDTLLSGEDLGLPIPKQVTRIDPGSGKSRNISVLGIRQLMFDHIAVLALDEVCKRIGVTQVSSIKGRGAHYGIKFIKKWLSSDHKLYATKLDIKDFYGSVDRDCMMAWLEKRICNERLMWLIHELVYSVPRGMAIGSFLSQTLANIYLSDLYHFAKEECVTKRSGKRNNQVKHTLFYMDDMLFIGTNKRSLSKAIKAIIKRASSVLHLMIKPSWQIHRITKRHPVDMMGFRISPGGLVTLRKHIFRKARKLLIKVKGGVMSLRQSLRLMSYKGYMDSAATRYVQRALNAIKSFSRASNIISHYAQAAR